MSLSLLLQPGRIGSLVLPNRLIMAPIATRAAGPEGSLTSALEEFYELRARGGVGLIIMGHTYCWREENTGGNLGLWSDDHIPPLADLARRIHAYGTKLAIQLGGRGTRRPDGNSMAPSPVRFAFEKATPRPIGLEEIAHFVKHYGLAAGRAKRAGLDAVEIHAAHGKLVSLFLSPYSNRRTDAYGGTLEKRTLFARQIVESIRANVGPDFPIIMRLSADDMLYGGNTIEDGAAIAKIMADCGVDAFEVSAGNQECGWNTSFSYFFPRACLKDLPAPIKAASGKPVIEVGKVGDPAMAEKLLEEGRADFISMGRPFIADPELLQKARQGRYQDIRRCLYCLNCFTYASRSERISVPGITCTVNPFLFREEAMADPAPAAVPKKILVVGGGLAGMACAKWLGRRGHAVELHEAGEALGGQWIVASMSPTKRDFRTIVPYLEHGMEQAGVAVHLNSPVDLARIKAAAPDIVVLATGARPRALPLEVPEGGPAMVQAMDVIMHKASVGARVVVVGGRYIGMEAAIQLAAAGHHVSLIEAMELGHGTINRLLGIYRNLLVENDVHIFPRTPLMRMVPGGCHVANNDSMLFLPADTVVTAIGTTPNQDLADQLQAEGISFHSIGDCHRIGDALFAIREGAELGQAL